MSLDGWWIVKLLNFNKNYDNQSEIHLIFFETNETLNIEFVCEWKSLKATKERSRDVHYSAALFSKSTESSNNTQGGEWIQSWLKIFRLN
jgi:hypothetical protein